MGVFVTIGIGAGRHEPRHAVHESLNVGVRGVVGQQMVDHVDAGSGCGPFTSVDACVNPDYGFVLRRGFSDFDSFDDSAFVGFADDESLGQ